MTMDDDEVFIRQISLGLRWFEWGDRHFARLPDHPRGPTLEFENSVGMVRNESGTNLYTFLTPRYLHTATRCFQAAALLLKEPYGSVPVETLLRSVLIASTKALYVLQPPHSQSRDAALWRLYGVDRAALADAEVRELKLFGLVGSGQESPADTRQTIKESAVIRDRLDRMIATGNCTCGSDRCAQ